MGRRSKTKFNMPLTLVQMIKSICADYDRRADIIIHSLASDDVTEEYIKLNKAVDDAFSDVEIGLKKHLLEDIKTGRGYEASLASSFIAKNTYYKRKKKIIFDVARSLSLL